jgi:hypothetical protein
MLTEGADWKIAVVASNRQLAEQARRALSSRQYLNTNTIASVTITSTQWLEDIDGRSVMARLVGKCATSGRRRDVAAVLNPVELVFAATELDGNGIPPRAFRRWLKSPSADFRHMVLCIMLNRLMLWTQGNGVASWLWRYERKHGALPCKMFRTQFMLDGSDLDDMRELAEYHDRRMLHI